MHRFFIQNNQKNPTKEIILTDDLFHQLSRVLRIKPFESIEVIYENLKMKGNFNGQKIIIDSYKNIENEKNPKIILVQGLLKNQKNAFVIQKATELNASKIILWQSDWSIPKINNFEDKKKRYEKIMIEASEQTRRDILPELDYISNLNELGPSKNDLVLVPYESEKNEHINSYLSNLSLYEKIFIIIGPEGGISPSEINLINEKGWNIVSLGKNILRSETASLFSLIAISLSQ